MSQTRRPLGSVASFINVGGVDALRRRAGPERTPIERHTMRMYERRQESWRRLNKDRVAAFIRLFLMCFVEVENGRPLERVTYRMLKKKLCKRIILWICKWLVFSMDEIYWPITRKDFEELNHYLVAHLPRRAREDDWQTVSYFFKEVEKK